MKWLFPSSTKTYDTKLAFEENKRIDWRYNQEKVNIGDIVFIYVSSPVSSITHMTKVVELDVPKNELINDKKYWIDKSKYEEKKCLRLELIKALDDERLNYLNLKKHGLTTNVQGKARITGDLSDYIDECLKESIIVRKDIFPRIIVCNIGWMEKYDGPAPIVGGGAWVKEHEYGHELKNFYDNNGYYEGFVESSNGKIKLERISPDATGNSIDDVLVVFTAKNPAKNRTIVGFYNHATVYRNLQSRNDEYLGYYFKAKVEDSLLLPVKERNFSFDSNKKGNIGESNVWYADSFEAIEQINRIQEYILDIINEKEVELKENIKYSEGQIKEHLITERERNPQARKACLEKYGFKCMVCGFDFLKFYGPIGKNYIHVHHINFISNTEGEHEINPENDLIPVCPNCHAMLHRCINKRYLTVVELKQAIYDSSHFKIGDKIIHPVNGRGEIISIDDKFAIINFLKKGKMRITIETLKSCEKFYE